MHPTIQTYFNQYRLNAVLITNLLNVRYLTGFTGTNGLVLLTPEQSFFFTDFRYLEQVKKEVHGFKIIKSDRDLGKTVATILKNKRGLRLGFEAEDVSVARHARLKKSLAGVTLVPITEDTALLRAIKTPVEIRKLAHALHINKLAFDEIRPQIKPGVREIDIALKLEFALRKYGAEKLAFDTIIASGKRGAMPHGKASNKKIKSGELVTIDFGGVYQGYHADETVTLLVERDRPSIPSSAEVGQSHSPPLLRKGEGRERFRQLAIHQIILDAQQHAIKKARPRVKCSDLDKAARDYITKKGYGQYFGHALGHGVGLEVHEHPVLSPHSKDILKVGMVFTIEPGIYIPGWGGIRVEDVFVCTKSDPRQLTQIDKQLLTCF